MIEIVKGNPSYQKYKNARLITTEWNLAELYYAVLMNRKGDPLATFMHFRKFLTAITPRSIVKGMELKYARRQNRLSYVDCIGYALALEHDIKFLTGDKEFKDMPNVEWTV